MPWSCLSSDRLRLRDIWTRSNAHSKCLYLFTFSHKDTWSSISYEFIINHLGRMNWEVSGDIEPFCVPRSLILAKQISIMGNFRTYKITEGCLAPLFLRSNNAIPINHMGSESWKIEFGEFRKCCYTNLSYSAFKLHILSISAFPGKRTCDLDFVSVMP